MDSKKPLPNSRGPLHSRSGDASRLVPALPNQMPRESESSWPGGGFPHIMAANVRFLPDIRLGCTLRPRQSEGPRITMAWPTAYMLSASYPGPLEKKSALNLAEGVYSLGTSSMGKIASTGHSGTQAPQSMQVSGSM